MVKTRISYECFGGLIEAFVHQHILVAEWMIVQHRHDFETMLCVKGRGLESECGEQRLTAASPASFLLRASSRTRIDSHSPSVMPVAVELNS